MLSDPINTSYGFALTDSGGTAYTLRRTDKGRFVSTDGPFSLDQPARYTVTPRVKMLGPSSVRTRYEVDKNLAPVNGVQQQDDTAYCEINFGGNMRSFTAVDIQNLINAAAHLARVNAAAYLRGES